MSVVMVGGKRLSGLDSAELDSAGAEIDNICCPSGL